MPGAKEVVLSLRTCSGGLVLCKSARIDQPSLDERCAQLDVFALADSVALPCRIETSIESVSRNGIGDITPQGQDSGHGR